MHKNEILNDQITFNDHDIIKQWNPHHKLHTLSTPSIPSPKFHKQHEFQNQLGTPPNTEQKTLSCKCCDEGVTQKWRFITVLKILFYSLLIDNK